MEIIWKDRKRTICGLPFSFTKYSMDEERLYVERGFFKTTSDEVRLYRIMDVRLTRSLRQKIWGIGDIEVHSSDKTLRDFTIKAVKLPKEVKEMLSQSVERQRDLKRVVNREMMGDHDDFSFDFDNDNDDEN